MERGFVTKDALNRRLSPGRPSTRTRRGVRTLPGKRPSFVRGVTLMRTEIYETLHPEAEHGGAAGVAADGRAALID